MQDLVWFPTVFLRSVTSPNYHILNETVRELGRGRAIVPTINDPLDDITWLVVDLVR